MTEHKTLVEAMLAVQAELPRIQKDKINPAFKSKYASLGAVNGAALAALNSHGLVWMTFPCSDARGRPALRYELIHAISGEMKTGTMPLLVARSDPQGMGSALTYGKRQTVEAVTGIVADEDDDGNAASTPAPVRAAAASNGEPSKERLATEKQINLINLRAGMQKLTPVGFLNALRVGSGVAPITEEITDKVADEAAKRILARLPASYVDGILTAIAGPEILGGSDIPSDDGSLEAELLAGFPGSEVAS